MAHTPGQYISIKVFLSEMNLYQARQYSVSSIPGHEYYRISVKAEKGANLDTNGLISNHLHQKVKVGDVINLTAPAGDFLLPDDLAAPVVLISGGVGLTPLYSMLQDLLERDFNYPIYWLHGCRNRSVHAFKEQIYDITAKHDHITQHIFYDETTNLDLKEGILNGFLDLSKISSLPVDAAAKYYICGPAAFIRKQYGDLRAKGIDREAIFFEEFGPSVIQMN